MRLIDADKAYEVLTEYYHHRTQGQHDALQDAISRVPTSETNQWIPVTEGLPKHNEDVLISCGPIVEAGWYNEIDGAWCAEGWSSLPVTAWMPLPEPYEEDEE